MRKITTLIPALITGFVFSVHAAEQPTDAASPATVPAKPSANESNSYLQRASELVIHALALIGVNYKYGGKSADDGLDCSGLVGLVFQDVAGMVLPRDSRALSKVGRRVDKTSLQPGDLVFFNTRRQPYTHVGIYIGGDRFVHAPSWGRAVEIANMDDRYWHARYDGARRLLF